MRECDRKFSNLNPEMSSLSEIREKAYQQGWEDAIKRITEKCEANSYTANSHLFAKWLREQMEDEDEV